MIKLLKKILGIPNKPRVSGYSTPDFYIECKEGDVQHAPILLPMKNGNYLDLFMDGSNIKFRGVVGCVVCKQRMQMIFPIILPSFWDRRRFESNNEHQQEEAKNGA